MLKGGLGACIRIYTIDGVIGYQSIAHNIKDSTLMAKKFKAKRGALIATTPSTPTQPTKGGQDE